MPDKLNKILVVGAGGALGLEISRLASARAKKVIGTYRTKREGVEQAIGEAGAIPIRLDIDDRKSARMLIEDCDAAIFTPILSVSSVAAPNLGDKPAIFFSSNNVAIDPGAEVYATLLRAECSVREAAPQAVILRPTMIYGYAGDGNMASLVAAMRRWPVMPLFGNESALQQPVFYKDLANAAVNALFDGAACGKTKAVSGPAPVSKRALYAAAAAVSGKKSRIVTLPSSLFANALAVFEGLGLKMPVSSAQIRRSDLDKIPKGEDVILTPTTLEEGLKDFSGDNLK
ncbi:hypothetical protein PUV54_14475 [Hyphococcus flavus]|uniref:Uncharacterized protein n=1 Tax=Hyphococcus flavus TaxID=1866326 RepID=A0AAF0CFM7_9PROT|nr:hypothetical protein [Hyphococcus flavus]WDI31153.1 hypothetical protein PUV54_14475 [Hyphococcus flavus]